MDKGISGKELITVAVAVYNAKDYLAKAVDSIIEQDYQHLDILLVDDGSTDGSSLICDEYVKKDTRIRVIHQNNGGLCVARNTAIENMLGNYLMFVDNDDWIEKNTVSFLYNKMIENNLDMASCSAVDIDEDLKNKKYNIRGGDKVFDSKEGIIDFYYARKFTFDGIQCKLYRKEVFKDLRFLPGRSVDDTLTTPQIMDKCKLMGYYDVCLYDYLVRKNSMCRSNYNSKSIDKVLAYIDNYQLIANKYPEALKLLEHNIYGSAATNLLRLKVLKLEDEYMSDYKFYLELLKKYKPIISKDRLFVSMFYYLNKIPGMIDLLCILFNKTIAKAVGA